MLCSLSPFSPSRGRCWPQQGLGRGIWGGRGEARGGTGNWGERGDEVKSSGLIWANHVNSTRDPPTTNVMSALQRHQIHREKFLAQDQVRGGEKMGSATASPCHTPPDISLFTRQRQAYPRRGRPRGPLPLRSGAPQQWRQRARPRTKSTGSGCHEEAA
jgi:hypothetical protein